MFLVVRKFLCFLNIINVINLIFEFWVMMLNILGIKVRVNFLLLENIYNFIFLVS